MGVSRSFPVVALIASLAVVQSIGFDLFLLEFLDVAAGAHGLEVAPETHENIEVGKVAHQFGFVVVQQRV